MDLARFWRLVNQVDREYDQDDTRLRDRIVQAREYVDERLYRAEVVDPLPANAPAGKLMVTPGDIHLYVGAGPSAPLRRIPTQAI